MIFPLPQAIRGAAALLVKQARSRRERSGDGCADQWRCFRRLADRLAETQYGRDTGIERGLSYGAFRNRVPTRPYEGFVPYVDRALAGESDILWPGSCSNFAVSSGTTAGRTKYLPVTDAMLAHFRSTGLESLLLYANRTGRTDVFCGRHLFLGGSTTLERLKRGPGLDEGYSGDLSGITAKNLPCWAEALLYEPGREIAQIADWPTKIEEIAKRTLRRDIALVAGIPSWILVLAEALRRQADEAGLAVGRLRDLWPNLKCLVHGGVPIEPFVAELRNALGDDLDFHEVYPASEGFIAAQDAERALGLRLFADAGIFYEFAPLEDYDETAPEQLASSAVPLEDVETGRDYVLLMTTPGGLCRYIIGDVVRFTGTEVPRLVYAGRTKLQLSAFGEHVIERELTEALVEAAAIHGINVANFHVAPLFVSQNEGIRRGRHEWWIAVRGEARRMSEELLSLSLDRSLAQRNDDYDAKRKGGGLDQPLVRLVGPEVFEAWMKSNGKWGGQNKMPRCRSDRQIADGLAKIESMRPREDGEKRGAGSCATATSGTRV